MKFKDMNKNRIIIMNLLSTVILQGISFFTAPIFSGILGPANYGVVSVYHTWVSIFSTVLTLQATGAFALARSSFPMEDQNKYQFSVLSLSILSYVIGSMMLMLAFNGHEESILGLKKGLLPLALLQGITGYCITTLNSKYTYEFRAGRNFILSLSFSVISIGLSLTFINYLQPEMNYLGRVYGECITNFFFGLFAWSVFFSKGKTFAQKEYWKFTLPITLPTVFHMIALHLLGQSDKLMLQQMQNAASVGIYTLASTFSSIMHYIWTAFNNSWVPFYYEYTRLEQKREMKYHARNYILLFSELTAGFLLLTPEVFRLFATSEFWEGTLFIPIFVIGHYFVFMYSFPVNFEFYYKKTKYIAVATIFAALCNVLLNFILIHHMGIIGAVIATTIAHGIQFGCHYILARRVMREEYPFSIEDFAVGVTMLFVACGVFYVFFDSPYIRWGLGVILGCYIIACMVKRKTIF